MRSVGGCNAGCERGESCCCSVPVNECVRCGDCDYGDNQDAIEVRSHCRDVREPEVGDANPIP